MAPSELQRLFTDRDAFRELVGASRPGTTVELASLCGSALSLVAAGAAARLGGVHVFVMEDKDAAGYLYNDLYELEETCRPLFFPTGYKRSIQYGQEDPSGIVQRTAALNALRGEDRGTLLLCTCLLYTSPSPRDP